MVQELEVNIEPETEESVKFYVNGEEIVYHYQKPDDRKAFELKVREILNVAGFTPVENYQLKRDSDNVPFASLDEEVPVRNGDHFTALYKGDTPAS